MRALRGLSAAVLAFTFVGCGAGDVDELGRTTDDADRASETISSTVADDDVAGSNTDDGDRATEPIDSAVADDEEADQAAEPIDSTVADDPAAPSDATLTDGDDDDEPTPPLSTDLPDELRDVIDGAAPEAPAPGGLAGVVLPTDVDGVIALFDALPDELIGGSKAISARTQGDLAADYVSPDRASRYGFQAADLPNSFMGGFLPEPRADILVAFFVLSDDDDYTVETAGHDGDLYWVTLITTNSGYGIDGTELVYTVTWGEAGSAWAFTAGAPTETGRDELIAAFIAAASNLPDRQAKSPAELAAGAALLTIDDLGAEWLSLPHIPQSAEAFGGLATRAMADQPSCSAALESIERDGVELSGLLDVLAAASAARADSPTFVSEAVEVEHTVVVFENAGQLSEAFRSTRELGWLNCTVAIYDELVQAQYGATFPGATVSVETAIERPLELGDDSIALRFELTLQAPDGGGDLGVVQDISIVAVGRAISAVVQQSFGSEIDDAQMDDVIQRATERVLEQFGGSNDGGS